MTPTRIGNIKDIIVSVIKDVEQAFVEMQNDPMTIKNGFEVSYKAKYVLPYDSGNQLLGI